VSVSGEAASAKKKPQPQKVSQKTINEMKQMGMTKAIQKAASGNASPEFVEGAKRMYGQNRINAAKKPSANLNRSLEQTRTPKPASGKTVSVSNKSALNKKKTV
jgi:hypothetical protein